MRYVAVALLFFAGHAPAGEPIQVTTLPEGATLVIDFTSFGCFHQHRARYEFEGDEVTVSNYVQSRQKDPKRASKSQLQVVGTVELSRGELKKFDMTLNFHRGIKSGGCTTIDDIVLTLKKNGKTIAEEKYKDATCSIRTKPGLLTFFDIDERLEKSQKKQTKKKKDTNETKKR